MTEADIAVPLDDLGRDCDLRTSLTYGPRRNESFNKENSFPGCSEEHPRVS